MNELNPNHLVTSALHDQWHKLCAFLVFKSGELETKITSHDIERFSNSGCCNIVAEVRGEEIVLSLVNDAKALKLVRKEGGMPI